MQDSVGLSAGNLEPKFQVEMGWWQSPQQRHRHAKTKHERAKGFQQILGSVKEESLNMYVCQTSFPEGTPSGMKTS